METRYRAPAQPIRKECTAVLKRTAQAGGDRHSPFFLLITSLPRLLPQQHLPPTPRQPNPKQPKRPNPPICPGIMPRRPPNLILRKIQIPIRRNRHTIRPANPRVPYKHTQQPSRRIEDIDSVLFEITQIDEPVAVRLEAVGDAFLAVRDHGCLSADFGEGGVVTQARGGDAVQIAARDGGPVEGFAVGGEGDAVGAGRAGDDALVGAGDAVDGLAPDELEELLLGADLRDVVEVAP